jgi:chromosome segregation ATPase
LQEQTRQRSQQEADLRAGIEALNRTAANQMASIQAAEGQRSAMEQRILEAKDLLEETQQAHRRGVEQEAELRAAREAALARAEKEAQARAEVEAERRTQQRKQLEVEEKELAQQTEELARRKAAVDASRCVLEDGARRMAEVQEQITAAETAQRRAERERLRLEAEVRLRAEKEEERLKETRGRIAEAHKEIGALRYHADEEERQLGDLRALVAKAEKASEKRTRLKKSLAAKIEAVKPNGNGSPN